MSFRRRTYAEVLDNILTGVVMGVSAETHAFPPAGSEDPPYIHYLEKPDVTEIISVYGSRNGQPHQFRKNVDYVLQDQKALAWAEEGSGLPDEGTLFHINYHTRASQPRLTDIYPGSVLRTLSETVAMEISRLYGQLQVVYDSAFIESASGSALNKVVGLLGIARVTGNHPTGELLFTRSASSTGTITIPAGTRVTTIDGEVEYETTTTVTLAAGQRTIRVVVRDLEVTNDPLGAGALTVLPIPIAGIENVSNPNPTSITTQAETDAELRARAKNFLHGSERATLGALTHAVARQGVSAEVIEQRERPGYVDVVVHAEELPPELAERVQAAIREARPAGVFIPVPQSIAPRRVYLELYLVTNPDLLPEELRAVQETVRERVQDFFVRLPSKSNASLNKIAGLVLGVPGVEDMQLITATWDERGSEEDVLDLAGGVLRLEGHATVLDRLSIADPNLPSLLIVTITYPVGSDPPDPDAIRTELGQTALTYLNGVNAEPLAGDATDLEKAKRVVSYGKLLRAISLPNKPGESLQSYDQSLDAGVPVSLPTESAISPYKVTFAISQESGFSQILSQEGDIYKLTPFERLSLGEVEVSIEVLG